MLNSENFGYLTGALAFDIYMVFRIKMFEHRRYVSVYQIVKRRYIL